MTKFEEMSVLCFDWRETWQQWTELGHQIPNMLVTAVADHIGAPSDRVPVLGKGSARRFVDVYAPDLGEYEEEPEESDESIADISYAIANRENCARLQPDGWWCFTLGIVFEETRETFPKHCTLVHGKFFLESMTAIKVLLRESKEQPLRIDITKEDSLREFGKLVEEAVTKHFKRDYFSRGAVNNGSPIGYITFPAKN